MKTVTERGISVNIRHQCTAGYEQHVRESIRGLFKPMGTETERNERAAVEIARRLYADKHGEPPPPGASPLCLWTKNRRGQSVIRAVKFRHTLASIEPVEIPGWNGPPKAEADPDAQGSMF